jgi:DNA ligase-4
MTAIDQQQQHQQDVIPSNKQAAATLEQIEEQAADARNHAELSATGRQVLSTAEDLAESTRKLLLEKNEGNHLQEIAYNLRRASEVAESERPTMQPQQLQGYDQVKEHVENLVELAKMFVGSADFRALVNDLRDAVASAAGKATQQVQERAEQHPAGEQARESASRIDRTAHTDASYEHKTNVAQQQAQQVAQSMPSKEEVEGEVRSAAETVKQELPSKEEVVQRFRTLLDKVRQKPQFNELLDHLSEALIGIADLVAAFADSAHGKAKEMTSVNYLKHALDHALALIQNFAKGFEVRKIVTAVKNLPTLSEEEKQRAREFLKRIKDKHFVEGQEFSRDIDSFGQWIQARGEELYAKSDEVLNHLSGLYESLSNDKLLKSYGDDLSNLAQELFLDAQGRPTVKTELLSDIPRLIMFFGHLLQSLELPDVQNSDESVDFLLRDIKVIAQTPARAILKSKTEYNSKTGLASTLITAKLNGVHFSAKNIRFYYTKKTIPHMTDNGLVDFTTDDDGMDLDVQLRLGPGKNSDDQHIFRVVNVKCEIDDMSVNIHEANHQVLYTLFSPLIKRRIRQTLEERIVSGLKEQMIKLDQQLQATANLAADKISVGAETVQSQLSTGAEAVQSQLSTGVEEVKAELRDTSALGSQQLGNSSVNFSR